MVRIRICPDLQGNSRTHDFTAGTLDNGFNVATDYSSRHKTVAVYWALRSGTAEDTVHGSAHFFEHLFASHLLKNGAESYRRLDDISSGNNFTTGPDSIQAYAYVKPQYVSEVVGIIGGCVTDPVWTPKILDRERAAVAQELREQQGSPFSSCLFGSLESAYPGHPLGRNVLGTQDNILAMSNGHLRTIWTPIPRPTHGPVRVRQPPP